MNKDTTPSIPAPVAPALGIYEVDEFRKFRDYDPADPGNSFLPTLYPYSAEDPDCNWVCWSYCVVAANAAEAVARIKAKYPDDPTTWADGFFIVRNYENPMPLDEPFGLSTVRVPGRKAARWRGREYLPA